MWPVWGGRGSQRQGRGAQPDTVGTVLQVAGTARAKAQGIRAHDVVVALKEAQCDQSPGDGESAVGPEPAGRGVRDEQAPQDSRLGWKERLHLQAGGSQGRSREEHRTCPGEGAPGALPEVLRRACCLPRAQTAAAT